jgi:hypothetical protein
MHEKDFVKARALYSEMERIMSRIEVAETMPLSLATVVDNSGSWGLAAQVLDVHEQDLTSICRAAIIADMQRRIVECRADLKKLGMQTIDDTDNVIALLPAPAKRRKAAKPRKKKPGLTGNLEAAE